MEGGLEYGPDSTVWPRDLRTSVGMALTRTPRTTATPIDSSTAHLCFYAGHAGNRHIEALKIRTEPLLYLHITRP